ncbi:MAG: hypothetical protein GKC10_04960 [Methanosarcinales archaeon]|nr:hypothetical protein [Methanosarcinales archaeon]
MRCVNCKGKGLCGRPVCPVLRRFEEMACLPPLGERIAGDSPPEVFVGRRGYPTVRSGPLLPVGDGEGPGMAGTQSLAGLDIGEIIALRSRMVRSETEIRVDDARNPGRLLQTAQQIAMSSLAVGTEVCFARPPRGNLRFDGVLSPSGPSGLLKEVDITSNPVIPRRVDQVVDDQGMRAAEASVELYRDGISVDHISRLLSLGLLGSRRKLVPTRWSITASDDMLGKDLAGRLPDLPLVTDYRLYSGELLGNHFEILLMPRTYQFELIEMWLPRSAWSEDETWIGADGEGPRGKKDYSSLAGGYYAARLPVLEGLMRLGRQASVLALREITEQYWAPLGVWVVREAARRAMAAAPERFDGLQEALARAGSRIWTPADRWRPHSTTLRAPAQTTLEDFLKTAG